MDQEEKEESNSFGDINRCHHFVVLCRRLWRGSSNEEAVTPTHDTASGLSTHRKAMKETSTGSIAFTGHLQNPGRFKWGSDPVCDRKGRRHI